MTQNRRERSHAGPYWLPSCPAAQHTFNTVAAAALPCLVCARVWVCVCLFLCVHAIPLHGVCLAAAVPTSMRVSRARLTSLYPEATSKRPRMGCGGTGCARLANARLLPLWALGTGKLGVKVGRWGVGMGMGVLQDVEKVTKGGHVCVCVCQEDRDRRHGTGGKGCY